MQEIIKRLEIIQHAIALEDSDIVDLQEAKLSALAVDSDVRHILSLLRERKFGRAAALADQYINQQRIITPYIDPEIQGLKAELRILENRLQELSDEKNEAEKIIHAFTVRYHDRLGDIIEEILRIRKEQYREAAEHDPQYQEAYEEAEEEYASFRQKHQQAVEEPPPIELNEEDSRNLKSLYREASKLCHPDIVADEFKEEAEELFVALNQAYQMQDIKQVELILNQLKSGGGYGIASETVHDKVLLEQKISMLREKLSGLEQELAAVRSSDTWQTIQAIDDWNAYFDDLQKKLLNELESLKQTVT